MFTYRIPVPPSSGTPVFLNSVGQFILTFYIGEVSQKQLQFIDKGHGENSCSQLVKVF
jgi:hypothetical protein